MAIIDRACRAPVIGRSAILRRLTTSNSALPCSSGYSRGVDDPCHGRPFLLFSISRSGKGMFLRKVDQ